MNVDVPAEMQRQNTVKDAQIKRQVQMIQKMPSGIHSKVQNMLMPGSSEAAVQSPGPVLQTSSRKQTSLRLGPWSTREREEKNSKACKIFFRKEGQEASNEVATEFRDVETPAQQCKRHSRTRRTSAADRISHREPLAVCGGNDTAKLAKKRLAFSPHRQQNM